MIDRRVGRTRLVRINIEHPIYAPLWKVVMYGYGPTAVIPRLLAPASGVESAYLYGSWAARYLGESGEDPNDVDVLVIGDPDVAALYDIAREATATIGREVAINSMSPTRWAASDDGFVRTVRSLPLIELNLVSR